MHSCRLLAAAAAVLTCALITLGSVRAAPQQSCGRCEPRSCPRITAPCMCGTYLDICRCCPYCYKCPGDTCSVLNNERCAGGKRCLAPPDISPYMAVKYNGTCQ